MTKPTSSARRGSTRAALFASLLLTSNALLTTTATAQCELDWQPGAAANGPQGFVSAMVRTANGDLIAGGYFAVADNELVNNVARFDGTSWRAMGSGIAGNVRAATLMPNGDVVVGGAITAAGGMPASNIARWTGTSWSSVGTGVTGIIDHLITLPNGDLVAAGTLTMAGGQAVTDIARWNGSSWSAMGSTGLHAISALTVKPNGTLIAAGDAWTGVPEIVSWNGTAWVGLPGLATTSLLSVSVCQALSNGNLFIKAQNVNGVANGVAIWDGVQLNPLPLPPVHILEVLEAANGDLIAAARGNLATQPQSPVVRFDGTSWTTLGASTPGWITSILETPSGDVIIGGRVDDDGPHSAVARYQAGTWIPVGAPKPANVWAMQRLDNGDIIVAGEFSSIGGVPAANIARYDGTSYAPLGLGTDAPVTCLALANDGSLLVGGEFTLAGGTFTQHIAKWDGISWSPIGTGSPAAIRKVAQAGTGEIVALPSATPPVFHVFDGVTWDTVQAPSGTAQDLLVKPDGTMVVIGSFVIVSQGITLLSAFEFVGGQFAPVPGASGSIARSGTISPAGDIVIASGINGTPGIFTLEPQGLQLLHPWTWTAVPTAMQFLPTGELCVAGELDALSPANSVGVRIYDGTGWTQVGSGMTGDYITDIAFSGHGGLLACGQILTAGGNTSMNLARAVTNCPASVVTVGAGCTGSAGPMQLTTGSQPWIGSELEGTASGFAPQSLGLHVIGLIAPPIALPLSPAGCTLQLLPIQTDLLVPSAGTAQASMMLPNDASLVGQVFRTQVVAVELSSGGSLQQLVSTNALQMTIGAF
jgi:hypothetical protein